MKRKPIASLSLVGLLVACISVAQEAPKFPPPVKEHEWLTQFAGDWASESEANMGPGQPTIKCQGTMSSRMLGGLWLISEVKTEVPGMTMNAIQTIGYDPQKKKYVGTWVDSVVNHMWKYEGTVDPSGKILTLEAEGPNFMAEGKTAKFRDAYEFKSKDHIVATSSMKSEEGKWVVFMTGNVRRTK